MLPSFIEKWNRRARLGQRLRELAERDGEIPLPVTIKLIPAVNYRVDIQKGRRLTLRLSAEDFESDRGIQIFEHRLPVVVNLLSRTSPSVHGAFVNLHDVPDTRPNTVEFCSNNGGSILVPDPDFFNSDAYHNLRMAISEQRRWHERQDVIVWRGATTGKGTLLDDDLNFTAPDLRPRIKLCAILKSQPQVDAKIYISVQTDDDNAHERRLRAAGLFGDQVPRNEWLDHKYAIDIDGNSNAWSNLFTRLLFGCCVIKVASPDGYRQWYYDRLLPWENYVPIRSDLTDLLEIIDWCRNHETECSRIAAAGQQLAQSLTLTKETQTAVRYLNERLG